MTDPTGFFDATSADFARNYERKGRIQERFGVWTSLIAEHARPQGSVLDVGCGPGHLSCFAARHATSVTGIDPAPRMIELANERKRRDRIENVAFELGTLQDVAQQQRRADLVLCSSVLEYLPDLRQSLAILRDALAAHGTLLVSMPNGACWYRRLEMVTHAVVGRPAYRGLVKHVPTVAAFSAMSTEVGLRTIETRYCVTKHALRVLNPVLAEPQRAALFVAVLVVA